MNTSEPIAIDYEPQAGDVFACWGTDWIARAISLKTSSLFGPRGVRWAPSHVAVACPRWFPEHHLHCFWWESTSLNSRECLEAKQLVSGSQVHPIIGRIQDYCNAGGRVSVYRLTQYDTLTPKEIIHLRTLLGGFVGGSHKASNPPLFYDRHGAMISGTRIIRHFIWRNQLDSLFCSELLAAVLQRLGRLARANPAGYNPARLIRRLLTEGTYRFHTSFSSGDARIA